jgi:hypothetical protein
MTQNALYDEDILLWSEQQAAIVRRLGQTRRDLPNEFDVENVAEEIESVGRSELASVESLLDQALFHFIKVAVDPDNDAVRHWLSEIAAFQGDAARRYAPSMRQRIDLDDIWRQVKRRAGLELLDGDTFSRLPDKCPFELDELISVESDLAALAERLRLSMASAAPA